MLTGAHEIGGLRRGVALRLQLVDERVADIVPRQLILFVRRRPGESAPRQLRGKVGIRREREGAGADAAPHHALEREGARVTTQPELHRPARPGELRRRQALELGDRDVRPRSNCAARSAAGAPCPPRPVDSSCHVPGAAVGHSDRRGGFADQLPDLPGQGRPLHGLQRPWAGWLQRRGCRAPPTRATPTPTSSARSTNSGAAPDTGPISSAVSATAAHVEPPRGLAAAAGAVERGPHPPLELPGTRHADRERGRAVAPQRIRDVEQVPGVLASLGAGGNHAIVAGELALDAQAARRPPGERMEPVDGAGDPGERLRQAVAAADVGDLVEQHGPAPLVRPRVGDRRQHDRRAANTAGDRHGQLTAAQQADTTGGAGPARDVGEQLPPTPGR